MLEEMLRQIYKDTPISFDPYTYGITFTFTANGTLSGNINIQADSDFVILNTTYWSDYEQGGVYNNGNKITNDTRLLFDGSILLTDTGSGRTMMNQAVAVDSMFGTGQFPYVWSQPKLMRMNSNLQVQVTNFINTQANFPYVELNLYLQFNGLKVFKYP